MQFFKKLWQATLYSWAGLKAAYKDQWAFRAEVLILVIAVPLAFLVGVTTLQRLLLIGSILLMMMVELLNSAIETVVDRIGTEQHELSGRAKDMGSAAVLVAVINAVVVWLFILISTILSLLA